MSTDPNITYAANHLAFLQAQNDKLIADNQQLTERALYAERVWKELAASRKRLREKMAEWQSAHSAVVELRGLVESHMDMARGEWTCAVEIERLRAIEAAARSFWVMSRGTALEPEWMQKFRALGIALGELDGDEVRR